MPIDKRDSQDESTLTLTKAMWMIAIGLVVTILMAFVLGIAVHYIVEFFNKGWDLVG
jgi:tetrahydromethanopterin S-methyltransferase subunit B